jgi:hypothetical protein
LPLGLPLSHLSQPSFLFNSSSLRHFSTVKKSISLPNTLNTLHDKRTTEFNFFLETILNFEAPDFQKIMITPSVEALLLNVFKIVQMITHLLSLNLLKIQVAKESFNE